MEHFHQSNVLVECSIQTIKRTLKKAKLANEDHYLSVLFLNSPPEENRLSPAYKLLNRPIPTNLPRVISKANYLWKMGGCPKLEAPE